MTTATFLSSQIEFAAKTPGGSPGVKLYNEYFEAGEYGEVQGSSSISLNGDYRIAASGETSFQVATSDEAGWMQFELNHSVGADNVPRPVVGSIGGITFDYQSDQLAQMVFWTAPPNGPWTQHATHSLVATAGEWSSVEFGFSPVAAGELHAVQFVLPADTELLLDNVWLTTDQVDPIRLPQSYVPIGNNERDVFVFRGRNFTYDSVLSAIASPEPRASQQIVDSLLAITQPDGSIFSEVRAGHQLNFHGEPLAPYSQRRFVGDNAWVGTLFAQHYLATGDTRYYDAARKISDWIDQLRADDEMGGVYGGYDAEGQRVYWRSTEHSADVYAFETLMMTAAEQRGEVSAIQQHTERRENATRFLDAMYFEDSEFAHFATGTTTGTTLNTEVALDPQTFTLLATLPFTDKYDATKIMRWIDRELSATDVVAGRTVNGYTYSNAGDSRNKLWTEGTAQVAVLQQLIGNYRESQRLLDTLRYIQDSHQNSDGKGLVASTRDNLANPNLGSVYDARLHIGATSWLVFSERGGQNPFYPWGEVGAIPGTVQAVAGQEGIVVADLTNDPSTTVTATAIDAAFALNRQHDFIVSGRDYHNWAGASERWVRSSRTGDWYFILQTSQTSQLYRWGGRRNLQESRLVATLPADVHANLELLTNADESSLPSSVTPTVADGRVTLNPAGIAGDVVVNVTSQNEWQATNRQIHISFADPIVDGIVAYGDFTFAHSASGVQLFHDHLGLGEDWVRFRGAGDLANYRWVYVDEFRNVFAWNSGGTRLLGTLPEGYGVGQLVAWEAAELTQQYDVGVGPSYYQNYGGLNERWLTSSVVESGWIYITPDGTVFAWSGNGRDLSGDMQIASLTNREWTRPDLVYLAKGYVVDSTLGFDLLAPDPGNESTFSQANANGTAVLAKTGRLTVDGLLIAHLNQLFADHPDWLSDPDERWLT